MKYRFEHSSNNSYNDMYLQVDIIYLKVYLIKNKLKIFI